MRGRERLSPLRQLPPPPPEGMQTPLQVWAFDCCTCCHVPKEETLTARFSHLNSGEVLDVDEVKGLDVVKGFDVEAETCHDRSNTPTRPTGCLTPLMIPGEEQTEGEGSALAETNTANTASAFNEALPSKESTNHSEEFDQEGLVCFQDADDTDALSLQWNWPHVIVCCLTAVVVVVAALVTAVTMVQVIHLLMSRGMLRPCGESVAWGDGLEDSSGLHHALTTIPVLSVAAVGVCTVYLAGMAVTTYLRWSAGYVAANFVHQAWGWRVGVMACATGKHPASASVSLFLLLMCLRIVLGTVAVMKRLAALEVASMERFGVRRARWMILISLPLVLLLVLVDYLSAFLCTSLAYLAILLWAACNWQLLGGLILAQRLASDAVQQAPPAQAEQAREAVRVLRVQFLAAALAVATTGLHVLALFLLLGWYTPVREPVLVTEMHLAKPILGLLDGVVNAYCALLMSGVMSGTAEAEAEAGKRQRRRWASVSQRWRRQHCGRLFSREETSWNHQVQKLADRGISIEALLRFFREELPKEMPHYDAARHTTTDVVRQAVIPLTSARHCACAELMMQGSDGGPFVRPQKMVTHNWSNRFRDLVAAIIADALEESDFTMIAEQLVRDPSLLEKWVADRGAISRTYWVCAFAVNHHVGICASNPGHEVDSVTGKAFLLCSCGQPKAWNNSEPTLHDGRSIHCEMNKFRDMMRYLSATDPCFEQVVVVDAELRVFTRAWCMAEISFAEDLGMLQQLKVHHVDALARRSKQLTGMQMQDLYTSRPEDKQEILFHIRDVEAFNRNMQRHLFEDLLPSWGSEEQTALAGRVIRWHRTPVWDVSTTA